MISRSENVPKYLLNTIPATTTELLPTADMSTSSETTTVICTCMWFYFFGIYKKKMFEETKGVIGNRK
jgi:hypothetical protein